MQIGEGRFLRGFFDWMIAELHRAGLYEGSILVTTPRPARPEVLKTWARQENRFTVRRRGLFNGRTIDVEDNVTQVSRILDPHSQWTSFLGSADNPDITLVVSNTTEAGLVYHEEPWAPDRSPATVAGRLTRWFYHRYETLGEDAPSVDVLPFELVAQNGRVLQLLMAHYISAWGLSENFSVWLFTHNNFYNTLVDSIVTSAGPDTLDVIREPYYRLVVDGFGPLPYRMPFDQAGLSVEFVVDVIPYQALKIRALNGTHSALAALGTLAGLTTVGEVMNHPMLGEYVVRLLHNEILPTLPRFGLGRETIEQFATDVLERFQNPFLAHQLRDIQQNGLAKLTQRLLPAMSDYWSLTHDVPPLLTVGAAAVLITHNAALPAADGKNLMAAPLADAVQNAMSDIKTVGWEAAVRTRLDQAQSNNGL